LICWGEEGRSPSRLGRPWHAIRASVHEGHSHGEDVWGDRIPPLWSAGLELVRQGDAKVFKKIVRFVDRQGRKANMAKWKKYESMPKAVAREGRGIAKGVVKEFGLRP
jgi:hypothetical protein